MNALFAVGFLGGWELILILAVVLVLFGAKKLPELAKGLGQGIKEFKKATNEVQNEITSAMDDNRYTPPPPQRRLDNPPEPRPSEHASSTPAPATTEHKS
jgi:sec-independent protein translocase protein TatA